MDVLRKADHIAYIRFASVYRPFSDIASLREAVVALEEGRLPTLEERSLQLPLGGFNGEGSPRPMLVGEAGDHDYPEAVGQGGGAR
jgi:transcriptional repressor NrdR